MLTALDRTQSEVIFGCQEYIVSMAPQTVDHGLFAKIFLGPMVCINIGSRLRLLEHKI